MSSNGQHESGTWSGESTVSARQIEISDHHENGNSQKNISKQRKFNYSQIYLCAVVIGITGGMVATVYYFVLETMMHGMWHTLPAIIEPYFPNWLPTSNYVWIATMVGGFLVGLALYFFGLPGEMAQVVDKIHNPGKIDIGKSPAMVIAGNYWGWFSGDVYYHLPSHWQIT